MNCKPGDLAVVLADSPNTMQKTAGMIVTVLYRCTGATTRLPDGESSRSADSDWVVEFQRPIRIRKPKSGEYREARYACCVDSRLQPIRPGDVTDSEVRELYTPKLPEVA